MKKTILNLAVLAALLCPAGAQAQVIGTATETLPNGSTVFYTLTPSVWQNDEWSMKGNIARDADGYTYVTGSVDVSGDREIFVRKVDSSGGTVWAQVISNTGYYDYGRSATLAGGYLYVLGAMGTATGQNIWVAKYDPATGSQLAVNSYDAGSGANGYDIAADVSNVYVAGTSQSDIAIFKFQASNLAYVANATFDGGTGYNYYDSANAITVGPNGNLLVGGYIADINYGNEIWVAKYNPATLAQVWASTYTPTEDHPQWGDDQARAVKTDANGNVYVAGFYYNPDSGQDIWLGKFDTNGNLVYTRTKNGPSNGYDKGFGLALDPFGNVYITGKTEAYNIGQGDNIWLGKYGPSGALASELTMNSSYNGSEIGFDVEVSSWMAVVGGAFQDRLGLVNVYPEQFGPVQQLYAGPGYNPGSVMLSWTFDNTGAYDYKIQFTTYTANFTWDKNAAGVISGTDPDVTAGEQEIETINGLPTRITYGSGGGVAGPVYYFKIWASNDSGTTWAELSNVANTAPNTPYNYWMENTRGQDRFWVFNNSYGRTSALARDVSSNTYMVYGNGMGGLSITRFNPFGMAEWTSFYNNAQVNGTYNPSRAVFDAQGDLYVVGAANFALDSGNEAWIGKFNPAGLKIWDSTIAAMGSDIFNAITFDGAGKVYAGGEVANGQGGSDMLLARYEPLPTEPQMISSTTFNGSVPVTAPASIWGLTYDGANVYAGGYFSIVGTAADKDSAIVRFTPALAVADAHVYTNAQNAGVAGNDVISAIKYAGGSLYAAGSRNMDPNSPNPNFWMAKISTANWAQVWTSTYNSVDNMDAAAYELRVGADGVYAAGYENRYSSNGGQRNIVLRKVDLAGAVQWTKMVDGNYDGDSASASGLELGGDGYFYLSGQFNIMPGGEMGMPGMAKLAEPITGIAAMAGPKPCSAQLSWVTDTELPAGTTFYVQYSTALPGLWNFDADLAQYSFYTEYFNFNGAYINHIVPGLEAGNGAPVVGQSNIDSPRYYFKIGYKRPADAAVTAVIASTYTVANTPGTWDRMDRYPNGSLFVINNVHGEKMPLARDAAGNIYTAGSFNAWGWNANTAYVRKFNAAGQPLWTRYYSDAYENSAPVINALALDASGNVYAAGQSGSDGMLYYYNPPRQESATGKDMLLVKYASDGRMQWAHTYNFNYAGASGNDGAMGLGVNDTAVYAAGYAYGNSGRDAFVAKIDPSNGVLLSSVTIGAVYGIFNDLKLDASGNVYVVGGSSNGATGMDALIVKADANLGPVASVEMSAMGEDEAYAVAMDTYTSASPVLYVAGEMSSGGQQDATLNKFTAYVSSFTGAWLSTVTYNSANDNDDEAHGVALDGIGGVYLSGVEFRYDLNQGKNLFIRKYNTDGELIWAQTLNSAGSNEDNSGGIAADIAGNVFAAIDAAPLTATAGTTYTGTGLNGAGYFKHTQYSMITTNPKLTIRVNRLPNVGLGDVGVAVMPFSQTGGIDPNGVRMGPTSVSSGAVTFSLPSGRSYFVAISSHSMVPTISEQISDPGGNFFVDLNSDATRQYYISYRPAAADPVRKMSLHISGLTVNDYVMGEVFINNTGEKVAYSIIRATAASHTMEIENLGAAASGVYGMAVSVPARNQVLQVFMNGAFPTVDYYEADMANAMSMATGFDVGGSTNAPTITGLVSDFNFSPLEGARVRVERYECTVPLVAGICSTYYNTVFNKSALTDVGGRYNFYDVPVGYSYNVNVGKAGYESAGAQAIIAAPPPGTTAVPQFQDFQLALATYTLTGVLKYNGIPLPNATIMVYGDQNSYTYGTDSYRQCQYGGCGVRSDARVLTGADGSFTVPGITDGNARINASFEGGWRDLNYGNPSIVADDLRVVISSQGATSPASPANNPCRPGRAWVINSSGTCVLAGSVVFNIVPENANTAGLLYGNVTFITTYTVTDTDPLIISTSAPLTLMAQQRCDNGCQNSQMGFTSLAGTFTSNTTSYSIVLSTGVSYYQRVFSPSWAKATSFDSEVSPTTEAPTVRQDMSVVRAGGLHGVVKFPDGTSFKPVYGDGSTSYSADISLRGVNVDVNEGKNVDENGEFDFPNLAPGSYNITLRPNGGGFVWVPAVLENISVAEGKTTEAKIQLETGLAVQPQIYGLPAISTPSWGYFIIGVNSGEEMTQKKVTDLFFSDPKYSFDYSTSTGWGMKYMPPGQYDFYLMMGAKYDPCSSGDCMASYNQFANFIGRVKGLSVQKSDTNPNVGTAAQPIAINILGAVGQSSLAGTVQGSRMMTDSDLERMFGNFNETFNVIPAIMLYDTAGDLRGFSNGMPSALTFQGFEDGMMSRDIDTMKTYLADNPLDYGIWGLPPGRYTAVFANPNYPPVAKEITLPDNAAYNFNFDDQQIVTGGISGVVKSSATPSVPLAGARVYLKHRTVEKFTLTDSSGAFTFSNLPAGIYRLEVTRTGYVTVGQKTGLSGSDSVAFSGSKTLYMLPSESKLSGRLFMSKFPTTVTKAGVQLVAYDETRNVESPEAYLPKTEVQTDASGNYEITGVIPDHLYKLSAFYQGKLPEVLEVTARDGNTVINDITLKDIPPQIMIKVKRSADSVSKVDVVIKSPKQLISIPSCQYNPGQVFDPVSAVTLALVPGTNNTYLGQFTVTSSQQYYTVKVTAGDGSNKMVKEFVYDQVSNAKTEQYIQQESLAGGEVQMDKETEEYSGIELDPGALSYSTATSGTVDYSNLVGGFFSALPSVRTVKTAKGNLTITSAIKDLMASEVYNMDLSNASANKPFTLTLKYDKERGSSSQGLRIYQQDADGNWREVPGNYTVDPMLGVVSVDVASLTNAYEGTGGVTTPLGRKRAGMSSVSNGRYRPSTTSSSNGRFAVLTSPPITGTTAFAAGFEVYNLPNPFDLKTKTVTLSADALTSAGAYSTRGTVIKYNLPAGKSGSLKFVIYNLAGEKVRTLSQGSMAGGKVYYTEWDGKNDTNQDCASGVYFMLAYLDGKQLGSKAHKMAIIK